MADLEDTRVRMTYEVAIYREQLNLLRKEMERISLTALDITNAASTLNGLKPQQVLVPVGGGTYIRAEVKDTRVLLPIGADYLLEMEKGIAAAELSKRAEATKDAVSKLNTEFEKINAKLMEVAGNLREVESQANLSKRVEEGVKEDYI